MRAEDLDPESSRAKGHSELREVDKNRTWVPTPGVRKVTAWTDALQQWAAQRPRTGGTRRTGAEHTEQIEVRARTLVRERFGNISEARDVLRRLADLLDQLDEPAPTGKEKRDPPRRNTRRTRPTT